MPTWSNTSPRLDPTEENHGRGPVEPRRMFPYGVPPSIRSTGSVLTNVLVIASTTRVLYTRLAKEWEKIKETEEIKTDSPEPRLLEMTNTHEMPTTPSCRAYL